MNRRHRLLALLVVPSLLSAPVRVADAGDPPGTGSSIHQLVETRPQGRACVGVRIHLANVLLKPVIEPDEIELRDDKHDADLRSIMKWDVSPDGKTLTIRFRTESSHFGSGNAIRICLERSVFRPGRRIANERECWTIPTDLL